MSRLKELQNTFYTLKGRKDSLEKEKRILRKVLMDCTLEGDDLQEALLILQKIAQDTQAQVSDTISIPVTLALESVFGEGVNVKVEFVTRRGKTECDLHVLNENGEVDCFTCGGGTVDIMSIALRMALWKLEAKAIPAFFLDQPTHNLSDDSQEKAGCILKEISNRMGVQLLVVTHDEGLVEHADKVLRVQKENGGSVVK